MKTPLIILMVALCAVTTTSADPHAVASSDDDGAQRQRRTKSKGRNHNTSPMENLNKNAESESMDDMPVQASTGTSQTQQATLPEPSDNVISMTDDHYMSLPSSSKGNKGGGKKMSGSSKGGGKKMLEKRSKSSRGSKSGRSHIGSKSGKSSKGKGKGGGGIPTAPPVGPPTVPTPTISPVPGMPSPAPVPGMPTIGPTTRPPSVNPPGCTSPLADTILQSIPEVFTQNPNACCTFSGPTAVVVTHGLKDESTESNFEIFWDNFYSEIDSTTSFTDVCFVMTGIDDSVQTSKTVSDILSEVSVLVAQESSVPSVMVSDPTTDAVLAQTIRVIYETPTLSSIGVFNSGFDNLVVESILSGQAKLPYVGYESDEEYGTNAADVTLELLDGLAAVPLCYNARLGEVDLVGRRCAAYYEAVTTSPPPELEGVACSSETTSDEMISEIITTGANAVFSHIDCCEALGAAATAIREAGGTVYTGCMDDDTSSGGINFVTAPAISLQAYTVATWVILPVLQDLMGRDGRGEHFFPGLSSFINTEIFNSIIV